MINKEQILAALKKLGPSSPTAVANSMGAEPSAIGYHLRNMLAAKTIKAAGTSNSRVYALPDQDIEGVKSAAPQQRKKPGKRRKGKRAAAPRARSTAALDAFLPAITAGLGLVICNGAQAPQVFSPEHTQAIADLLLNHFEV